MKKRWLLPLIPFILACNYLLPSQEALPAQTETAPTEDAALFAPCEESLAPQAESAASDAFVVKRIVQSDGRFNAQLSSAARQAKALGLIPVIEFDATWCPACAAITESLAQEDPRVLRALGGIYLVRADVDEWGTGDSRKFDFNGIPIFFKLDYEGNPTGEEIDGDAWGANVPESFAPALDEFFHAP